MPTCLRKAQRSQRSQCSQRILSVVAGALLGCETEPYQYRIDTTTTTNIPSRSTAFTLNNLNKHHPKYVQENSHTYSNLNGYTSPHKNNNRYSKSSTTLRQVRHCNFCGRNNHFIQHCWQRMEMEQRNNNMTYTNNISYKPYSRQNKVFKTQYFIFAMITHIRNEIIINFYEL